MQLYTDFRDWYDFAFSNKGLLFERLSYSGFNRRDMLHFLSAAGLHTPAFGTVEALTERISEEWGNPLYDYALQRIVSLVVYTDENSHQGEGKILLSAAEALKDYPQHLASEYIPSITGLGFTFRWLQIGKAKWWLKYWSIDDWRSNVGDGGCSIIQRLPDGRPDNPAFIDFPMFAIDFVPSAGGLFAVDFNVAPGLGPLNGYVKGSEIVSLIKEEVKSCKYWRKHGHCLKARRRTGGKLCEK